MANIQMLNRQQNIGGGTLRARTVNSGAPLGPAIQDLASGAQAASEAYGEIQELNRVAERQRIEYGIDNDVRAQRTKWATMKGSDASGISGELDLWFEDYIGEKLEGIGNERTRIEVEGYLYDSKAKTADWAVNHVLRETDEAINSADSLTHDNMLEEMNFLGVGDIEGMMGLIDSAVTKHGELHSNPEVLETAREKYIDEATTHLYDKWFTEAPGSAAKSWRSRREALKNTLSTDAYTKIAKRYKQEQDSVKYNEALSTALRIVESDPDGAPERVLAPSFRSTNGIKTSDQMKIYSDIMTIRRNKEAQKERDRVLQDRDSIDKTFGILYTDGSIDVQGALTTLNELHRTNKISAETYPSVRNTILNAEMEVDQTKLGRVRAEVISGELDAIGILNEASTGGLGNHVTGLLALQDSVKTQREKDGRIIDYKALASKDYSRYASTFNGTYVTNKPAMTESQFIEAVRMKADELKGGPATAFDYEYYVATQEVMKSMAPAQEVLPDTSINYIDETRRMYHAYASRYNPKDAKDTEAMDAQAGVFTATIKALVEQEVGGPVTQHDPRILKMAQHYLERGVYHKGQFLAGEKPQYFRFGETVGARFAFDENFKGMDYTTGRIDPETWANDPSLIPGDTPEAKAEAFLKALGAEYTDEDYNETVEDIRAIMETK